MKGRDILKDLTQAKTAESTSRKSPKHRPSGSVRALKSELDQIANDAASAKELKASIEREGQIVELSPDCIDSAAIGDRIPDKNDEKFEELKKSISESQQSVPVLVRPKKAQDNRYEAAYGHRRIRAAKELGIPVRAIVRALTDKEMILAQGQENGPRLDLSFVERALYASRLLSNNYDRDLICLALSVDKPEVSRLLQVAKDIDEDIILAVGPARKIGRPRWVQLANLLEDKVFRNRIDELINSNEYGKIEDSNLRFEELLKLQLTVKKVPKPKQKTTKTKLTDEDNEQFGWSQITSKGVSFNIEDKALSLFLIEKLPSLVGEFKSRKMDNN